MTIKTRSNLNLILFIFSCILFGLYAAIFIYEAITSNFIFPDVFFKTTPSDSILFGYNSMVIIFSIFAELLYVMVTTIIVSRSFAKTQSSIVIFFLFYILAIFADTTRMWIPLFHIANSYSQILIIIGNTTLFARITAPLALFTTSILHFDEQHQNINKYILILLFASLAIATVIPINTSKIMPNFCVSHGYTKTLHISTIFILLVSIISIAICNMNGEKNYIQTIGFMLMCIGTELIFNVDRLFIIIIAFIMMEAGTMLYLTTLHNNYLMN